MRLLPLFFIMWAGLAHTQDCTDTPFDDYPAGTVVTAQFDGGVFSCTNFNGPNTLMLFDSDNPSGDDLDLGAGIGMVLIISEDGDSSDPDDDADGGIINIDFTEPSTINNVPFIDIENSKTYIRLYSETDDLLWDTTIPQTGNGGIVYIGVPPIFAARVEIELGGSGAVGPFEVCTDNSLAVALSEFYAINVEGINTLRWTAAAETAFSHYEVEHSTTGSTWESVAAIRGGQQYYQYEHITNLGRHYYRLRMVDIDGSISYSDVRRVDNYIDVFENPYVLANSKIYNQSGAMINNLSDVSAGVYYVVYRDSAVYRVVRTR